MLALAVLSIAIAEPAHGVVDARVAAGLQAARELRYCDASNIFQQRYADTHDALTLYRAAETAFAANDFVDALRLYRMLLDHHAGFEKLDVVRQRVDALVVRVRRSGPGTGCALPSRLCGDWIVSTGESCDDGNIVDGDGCDSTCAISACGNGVRAGAEVCDDGNLVDGDGCDSTCALSACGNGVRAGAEVCDDGNLVDGDGCSAQCVREVTHVASDADAETHATNTRDASAPPPAAAAAVSPWLLGGGVGVGLGLGLVGIGLIPYLQHEAARGAIDAAEQRATSTPATASTERDVAAQEQQRQSAASAAWSSWGAWTAWGGAAVTVVAGAIAGVALVDGDDVPVVSPTAAAASASTSR